MEKNFRIMEYKQYGDDAFEWVESNIMKLHPECFDTLERAKHYVEIYNKNSTYSWGRMTTYRVEEIF